MQEKTQIQDKLIFYILSKLNRFGHEKLPLQIIKEKQSYIIGHKRKRWMSGEEYLEAGCKITFVKKNKNWKLYWKRADLKWHLYEEYSHLDDLLKEVRTDRYGCFWG
jgi:hypothetical protein